MDLLDLTPLMLKPIFPILCQKVDPLADLGQGGGGPLTIITDLRLMSWPFRTTSLLVLPPHLCLIRKEVNAVISVRSLNDLQSYQSVQLPPPYPNMG